MDELNVKGVEETVICYIKKRHEVLMLFRNKKKHDINKNKWIGVGGHIEKDETPVEAVIREVKEETNLNIVNLEKKAIIIFHFGEKMEIMHVFTSNDFTGRIVSDCSEGTLKWIPISQLYEYPLWEGDKIFLKKIFANEPFFEMVMWYDGDKLSKYELLNDKE